jgi:peptidyl-prolyl cis-trans isomerase B (cyclophilin B)
MKKIILSLLFFSTSLFFCSAQGQFGGKPQYDILVRQYPDTFGTIRIELYPTVAPLHCQNFDTLARQGFYDSLAFHRVVPNFVIQGGDPNSKTGPTSTWGQGAPWQQTVPAEFSPIPHEREIIGAARAANINSATSQFYINLANNSNLNGLYTAYGRVISGMNVVDSVEIVPRNANDLPLNKVDMFLQYVGTDSSAPAQAPSLTFPAENASNILRGTVFTWSAVTPVDFILYRIQFSKQSNFSSIAYQKDIRPNIASFAPGDSLEQGNVTYFWRVLTNNGGNLTASSSRSFSTGITVPILLSPVDQATNIFLNPYLDWDTVIGANEYHLIISKVPVLAIPAQNVVDTIVSNSIFLSHELEASRPYYWGVSSIDNGIEGDFAPIWKFTTGTLINGIQSFGNHDFQFFPNPAEESLRISFDEPLSSNSSLVVYDQLGRKLEQWEIKKGKTNTELDLTRIPTGIYIVFLKGANGASFKKFIKK